MSGAQTSVYPTLHFGLLTAVVLLASACGGRADGGGDGATGDPASGGTPASGGGAGSGGDPGTGGEPSTGGLGPVEACSSPVVVATPCEAIGSYCSGPCVNSWQAVNACRGGTWELDSTVACGLNADEAPHCANSFSGEVTPCCPEETLDCTDRPDGYPGFYCTPRDGSYCSCACYGGELSCGC